MAQTRTHFLLMIFAGGVADKFDQKIIVVKNPFLCWNPGAHVHKGRPGLRFGRKLNSGVPRALDRSRLVGTIEDFGHDEAARSPTSTKPNKTQGPWSQAPWVILRRG